MRTFLRLVLPAMLVVGLCAVPTGAFEGGTAGVLAAATESPTEIPTETPTESPTEPPVYEDITFFLHGTERVGDLDVQSLAHMPMDTDEPTSPEAASRFILNYVVGPNSQCSGTPLFPTWDGFLDGQVQGTVKVVLTTLTHPGGTFNVELFADGGGACDDDYVAPVASQTVEFPAGQNEVEVVFENVDFTVAGILNLMIRPPDLVVDTPAGSASALAPNQGRVFYDGTAALSRVELQCLLPTGKTTCLY